MLELDKDLCVPDREAPHLQGPYILLGVVGR